jgi:hypothetical protein
MNIRTAMLGMGSRMLEILLNADAGDYRGRTIPCDKRLRNNKLPKDGDIPTLSYVSINHRKGIFTLKTVEGLS